MRFFYHFSYRNLAEWLETTSRESTTFWERSGRYLGAIFGSDPDQD